MGDCIDPQVISDIAAKDTNRLVGSVAKSLAANSPYINILRGGTFPQGVSDVVRSSIQMQAAPGDSLAEPTFVPSTQLCETVGTRERVGSVDLTYQLEGKRGYGPKVCVKDGYAAFKSSYLAAEDSLQKLITQYINSDVRAQTYRRSASKFVAAPGANFEDLFTGGTENDIGIGFAVGLLPIGPLSFEALHAVVRYVKEALFGEFFPADGKGQEHARFIAGVDQVEALREQLDPKWTALVSGRYRLGEEALTGYSFETSPSYRGIAFGVDHRPLRFAALDPISGQPILLNPVQIVTQTGGKAYARANPNWLKAPYEIGQLFFDGSFERLTPEKYMGEGTFRFAPQLVMGELKWHYVIDNDCNVHGDTGFHTYQIERAYRPRRPQWVVSIWYKRCRANLNLNACPSGTDFSESLSTGSGEINESQA